MTKAHRVVLLACAMLGTLAFAGSAFAAFVPRLVVTHSTMQVSQAGTTTVKVTLPREDESIAKVTIAAPLGYQATLNQAPGTQIGTVSARAQLRAINPDFILPIEGTIVVANPADLAAAATQCTGTPTHVAIWVLVLSAQGRELRVPVYVDRAQSAAEGTFVSVKMQICLPPPDIPEASGGAAFGAKVIEATLRIQNVFVTPVGRGEYGWTSFFTPYTNHKPPVNAAGTVEARAYVRLGVQLTIGFKWTNKAKKTGRLSGVLTEFSSGVAGISVRILVNGKSKASARTSGGGGYRATLKFKGKGKVRIQTRAVVGERNHPTGCISPGPRAPGGCVSATLAPFTATSRVLRVTVK